MNLVFDTSALSRIIGRDTGLIRLISSAEFTDFLLPLPADAELRYGLKNGSRNDKNIENYQNIIQAYGMKLVCPDQDTSIIYGELATWCRKQGVGLSNNDLWIAAIAVQSGGKLLSLDNDFKLLPQVGLAPIN